MIAYAVKSLATTSASLARMVDALVVEFKADSAQTVTLQDLSWRKDSFESFAIEVGTPAALLAAQKVSSCVFTSFAMMSLRTVSLTSASLVLALESSVGES